MSFEKILYDNDQNEAQLVARLEGKGFDMGFDKMKLSIAGSASKGEKPI